VYEKARYRRLSNRSVYGENNLLGSGDNKFLLRQWEPQAATRVKRAFNTLIILCTACPWRNFAELRAEWCFLSIHVTVETSGRHRRGWRTTSFKRHFIVVTICTTLQTSPWVTVLLSYHNARLLTRTPNIVSGYRWRSYHNARLVTDSASDWLTLLAQQSSQSGMRVWLMFPPRNKNGGRNFHVIAATSRSLLRHGSWWRDVTDWLRQLNRANIHHVVFRCHRCTTAQNTIIHIAHN
jgi:hypothetical protein